MGKQSFTEGTSIDGQTDTPDTGLWGFRPRHSCYYATDECFVERKPRAGSSCLTSVAGVSHPFGQTGILL